MTLPEELGIGISSPRDTTDPQARIEDQLELLREAVERLTAVATQGRRSTAEPPQAGRGEVVAA